MRYTKGYKYRLDEPESFLTFIYGYDISFQGICLTRQGVLYLEKGFAWNGADWAFDTKNIMIPSACHDALCDLINEGLLPPKTRLYADKLFHDMCMKEGMGWFRRKYTYLAVYWYTKVCFRVTKRKVYEI
jgi:hypothetical protein